MESILTITMNPTIDRSTRIDRVVPERKLRCEAPRYEPGGGGLNVSRAIRKLGGKSTAIYTSGGPHGQMLEKLLDREGIDHRPVSISDRTRESFTVFENTTGQQYRFSTPGPTLKEAEWMRCLDELFAIDQRPDYLVASGSLPPGAPDDFYARLARFAKEAGARMILDATANPFTLAVREGVFMIKPNLREFRALAEKDITDEGQQEELARQIVDSGQSEVVVVTLGSAGALLVWQEGSTQLRAPTVPIESKVGAGDSTVAGIVLGLSQGESLLDAVKFGLASGAAAVMTPGTELCRGEDARRLFRSMGNQ
ncbi:MAG: 1-phosphofructokinase family hexose kinase [Desulfobacterales bacterium]|jgi:6-phosphofructokinase 2